MSEDNKNKNDLLESFNIVSSGSLSEDIQKMDMKLSSLPDIEVREVVIKFKEDYEKLFEQERKKCLSLTNNFLKESTDSITKEKLLNVKEKLLEQTYKKDTFISDMVSFNDLINTLE